MHTPIPFKTQLLDGKIVLSGDLDGSRAVSQECEKALMQAVQQSLRWTIDASQARLPRGGVETWIAVVHELLDMCHLVYLPSQLAQNLQYDDEYRHGHSTFLETDDIAVGEYVPEK